MILNFFHKTSSLVAPSNIALLETIFTTPIITTTVEPSESHRTTPVDSNVDCDDHDEVANESIHTIYDNSSFLELDEESLLNPDEEDVEPQSLN